MTNANGNAVAGDELYFEGQQSGTFSGGLILGGPLSVNWNSTTDTLMLSGLESLADYQTLLTQITYQDDGTDSSIGSHPTRVVTWSANDAASYTYSGTSQVTIDRQPVVTTPNVLLSQSLVAASSLFSVSDPDGDSITEYVFWDTGAGGAHFVLNGVALGTNRSIVVTAAQLTQLAYQAGTSNDTVWVQAFDGTQWSTGAQAFTVAQLIPPVVTTANLTEGPNQTLAASNLFSVSDPDGDSITEYQFWDSNTSPNTGHFYLNGVQQPLATVLTISASQLSQMTFVTGTAASAIQVRAFDGTGWSAADTAAWAPFSISINLPPPPVVTTANLTEASNQTLAASSLFSVSDPGGNPITEYQFWDSNTSANTGHFYLNGVQQSLSTVIDISASQLSQMTFVTGTASSAIQIRAYDGVSWSAADNAAWSPFTINVNASVSAASPPVVTTVDLTEPANQTLAASSLFSVSDPGGNPITEYQFWDSNTSPNTGYFYLNGVVQRLSTVIDISASQLSQMTFVTGTASSAIQVRAYDGVSWSAADTAAWSPFTINVTPPPVVTTANLTESANQTLAASSLFSVSDPGGNPITEYQFWDSNTSSNTGHFYLNGAEQPLSTVIDISASQLSQLTFVTGTASSAIQIRAFDGTSWSASDTGAWSPFTISIAGSSHTASTDLVSSGSVSVAAGSSVSLGDGDYTVTAGANSSITLGNGNNTVLAGADDAWTVGTGQNTFSFNSAGFGSNTINGFGPGQDVIQFNQALFANYAAVLADTKQVGASAVITDPQGDSVTLAGITTGQLTASNVKIA